jgi:murein DD-endopeptidase MepM/ murein hydrolase activator NlpD
MAMTIQQAQMAAMQLRSRKPELQNMAVGDLVAQIMASEGAGQPAAGVGGLANLFATPLSPASPAPMQPAMLEAPKPTSLIVPGAENSSADPLSWMKSGVTSGYGQRASGMHQGVDYGISKDTPVGVPAPGVVEVAKKDNINGNYVVVRHPNGQSTSYSHLSALNVKPGQTVEKGDVLGASGNTGRVRGKGGGYHLHVGARDEKNNRIDPRGILKDPSVLGTAPARESAVAAGIDSAAAPAAAPTGQTMDAPKGRASRFRPMFEQKQAEFQQMQDALKAATPEGGKPPAQMAYDLGILSDELRQLKGLVTAEEGAVVDAERAAVLERKASRLGREEELIERTRRLAPGNALIAFGNALAGAKPGEKFASALARGLQAGSESYTGARDTREASLRGIEEKRDVFDIQRMDALDAARDRAIALQAGGDDRTKGLIALKAARGEGQLAEALNPLKVSVAQSEEKVAKVTADYAKQNADLAVRTAEAEIGAKDALRDYRRNPRTAGDSGIPKGVATYYAALGAQAKSLRTAADNILITDPKIKQGYRDELANVVAKMRSIEQQLNFSPAGAAAPAGATKTRTYNPKTGKLE